MNSSNKPSLPSDRKSTTKRPFSAKSSSAIGPTTIHSNGSANIELKRIRLHSDGKLVVEFSGRDRHWQIELTGEEIQSFRKFRAVVAEIHGLWTFHRSQREPTALDRRDEWGLAVAAAFQKGCRNA